MGSDEKTAAHLRLVFNRMGFNDQEIVALSGAHGLGRCHETSSGFWGPWTRAPSTGPLQYEDPSGDLMMLASDLVLTKDAGFKKFAEMYYKDETKFMQDFGKAFEKLMNLGF